MTAIRQAVARRLRDRGDGEAGFTLVELLVAMSLFLGLTTIVFTTVVSSARGVTLSREYNDLNEEARVMLNRMTRELREAKQIIAVSNPAGPAFSASSNSVVTFEVDFNGNGVIEPNAADPERLTYTYDVAARRVTLQAAGQNYPILAANVSAFKLTYASRLFQLDANDDGTVTWQEIDADATGSFGNNNGVLDQELSYIDSITIDLTVLTGTRRQDYRTQVDLRNRPY